MSNMDNTRMRLLRTKDLGAKEIKGLMLRSFKRYQQGKISEQQALRENQMLANMLKAIDMADLEEKISVLEQTIQRLK